MYNKVKVRTKVRVLLYALLQLYCKLSNQLLDFTYCISLVVNLSLSTVYYSLSKLFCFIITGPLATVAIYSMYYKCKYIVLHICSTKYV